MKYYVIDLPALQKLPVVDRFRLIYLLANAGDDSYYPRVVPAGLLNICGKIAHSNPITEAPHHYYHNLAVRYRSTSKTVQVVLREAELRHACWNKHGDTVAKRDCELLAMVFIRLVLD